MIGRLLGLPVRGPAKAAGWVIGHVVSAAEEQLHDEDRIVAEIRALSGQLEAGHITEEQHAHAEEFLLERLVEARAFHAEREGSP